MDQTGVAITTSVDRSAPPAGAPHAADDRAAALAAARQAAALLVERYGARRVYLFGSLAGTGSALFQPASDIDLAVEGLSEEVWWRSYPAVDEIMPPRHPANIIRLESAQLFIREVVLQRGALLASADDPIASRAEEAARPLDDEAMMERPRWRLLAEEIEHELAELDHVVQSLEPLVNSEAGGLSDLERIGVGALLHDFYNGAERSFERVARIVDGHVPTDEHWHQTLLAQMAAPYADLRPAVISGQLHLRLHKYLGYRHRFRNIYSRQLDWTRLSAPIATLDDTHRALSAELGAFCAYLRRHPAGREAEGAEAD